MIAPIHLHESDDYDAQLMARVAEGDTELFDELVQRNETRIRGLIARMKGSGSDVEDLTQQVFLQAYRARETYSPSAKFTTWLFVIARNVVLNAQRTAARRRETELLSPNAVESTCPNRGTFSSWYHPVSQVIREETQQMVAGAIERLPDRQRQAIELVGLDGCRYKVAAERMQVTEKAIKSLVHRAKMNLREMLEPDHPAGSVG